MKRETQDAEKEATLLKLGFATEELLESVVIRQRWCIHT